jgi:hypothetical protein
MREETEVLSARVAQAVSRSPRDSKRTLDYGSSAVFHVMHEEEFQPSPAPVRLQQAGQGGEGLEG